MSHKQHCKIFTCGFWKKVQWRLRFLSKDSDKLGASVILPRGVLSNERYKQWGENLSVLSENLGQEDDLWIFYLLVEVAVLGEMNRNTTCLVGLQIHTYWLCGPLGFFNSSPWSVYDVCFVFSPFFQLLLLLSVSPSSSQFSIIVLVISSYMVLLSLTLQTTF